MKKLKIICLVKIVPDVQNFTYDYEKNILVRENKKSIVNPDDACALAAALRMKSKWDAEVIIVSMGPESNRKHLEDLIRRGADQAVLISDDMYRGSDTFVTSKILSECIKKYDCSIVLCGVHSLDGDTAHIPSQLAELLDMNIMSNITKIKEEEYPDREIQVEVKDEGQSLLYAVDCPAVLGISSDSKYKLPFPRYEDRKKDVSGQLEIITNDDLGFLETETGLHGSKTKVVKTYPKKMKKEEKVVVQNDEAGIEYVYEFLKEKEFL